ncbi:MAG: nucleotide exchange factor GrpE [Candidatus Woesearchaeota archaeon]
MHKKEDINKKLRTSDDKQTQQLEAKIRELTDLLQRLQAEFENYKKRADKEKHDFCRFAEAKFISKLLPILDSFEIALKNKEDLDHANFVKGVEFIYSQLFDTLRKDGLKKIDALGKKFDPHFHEVLFQEESEKDNNIILEELQKGYMLDEKLLRTTKVKVSKKREDTIIKKYDDKQGNLQEKR